MKITETRTISSVLVKTGDKVEKGAPLLLLEDKESKELTDAQAALDKAMLDFEGREPVMIRSSQEDFLSDDVSIMIARNKKTKEYIRIVNLLKYTNENVLPFSEDIPAEAAF